MCAKGTIVKVTDFANTALDVWLNCERPKHSLFAQSIIPLDRQQSETRDIRFGGSSKEEEFIEIALAGEFRFLIWQADILSELPRAQCTQGNDGHTRFFGQRFEGFLGGGLLLCNRDTRVARQTNGFARRFQVEIVFWKIDAATIFSEEGLGMTYAAARIVQLNTRFAGHPNAGNFELVEFSLKAFESVQEFAARGEKRVHSAIDDGLCPEQMRPPKGAPIVREISVPPAPVPSADRTS